MSRAVAIETRRCSSRGRNQQPPILSIKRTILSSCFFTKRTETENTYTRTDTLTHWHTEKHGRSERNDCSSDRETPSSPLYSPLFYEKVDRVFLEFSRYARTIFFFFFASLIYSTKNTSDRLPLSGRIEDARVDPASNVGGRATSRFSEQTKEARTELRTVPWRVSVKFRDILNYRRM